MKILIIEDDHGIGSALQESLRQANFLVDWETDGTTGLRQALVHPYDAVVLDMFLPGKNGVDIAKGIREHKPSLPILVLTVEDTVDLKVEMLSLCDDYVTKPFSVPEVAARLKAITRRGDVMHHEILEVGDIHMDVGSCRVTRAGRDIRLRNKEFALLEYLMRHADVVVSREQILEYVWDKNADPFSNTVDVHIRLLRNKLDRDFPSQRICTIPGRGYRLQG